MKIWLQNQIILTKTQPQWHTDNNDSSALDNVLCCIRKSSSQISLGKSL